MEYIVHLPHSRCRRLRMPGMQLVARRGRPNSIGARCAAARQTVDMILKKCKETSN